MSKRQNPWKQLSTAQVYDNDWIAVYEDRVINPSGSESLYGRVKFKNKAIGIIPLDEHGNTWLIGQYRYTLDAYSWEIPMGGSLLSDHPLDGAKRELKEETGIIAAKWTKLMHLHTSNSVTDEEGIVYLAEELTMGEPEFGETEDLQIKKIPLVDAIRMTLDGEITDAVSVAGLLKIHSLL